MKTNELLLQDAYCKCGQFVHKVLNLYCPVLKVTDAYCKCVVGTKVPCFKSYRAVEKFWLALYIKIALF